MFQSVNELDKFSYDDCVLKKLIVSETGLTARVEALIVDANNSQNTNYTRSYAGDSEITFVHGRIDKVVKEGYRYYDANDVLMEEIPDEVLTDEEVETLLTRLNDVYLYDVQVMKTEQAGNGEQDSSVDASADQVCVLGIEFPTEDPNDLSLTADSYQIKVVYESVSVTWERYMNRVES